MKIKSNMFVINYNTKKNLYKMSESPKDKKNKK